MTKVRIQIPDAAKGYPVYGIIDNEEQFDDRFEVYEIDEEVLRRVRTDEVLYVDMTKQDWIDLIEGGGD